jgi:hypothetical protein
LRSEGIPTAGKGVGNPSRLKIEGIKDRFIAEFGSQSGH